jgi:hypothetical protein
MSDALVLQFYAAASALMAGTFLVACWVLSKKFSEKGDRRHMWAALAFGLLASQEIIVVSWLTGAAPLATRPWHFQQASVLASFVLLALAMFGRVRD